MKISADLAAAVRTGRHGPTSHLARQHCCQWRHLLLLLLASRPSRHAVPTSLWPPPTVQEVAEKYGIPAFQYVKVDIEGGEGDVFGPGADTSWITEAQAVSVKLHEAFARHYDLKVGGRPRMGVAGCEKKMRWA